MEELDDDCDLVMGDTGNPQLVRLASAPLILRRAAYSPTFFLQVTAAPRSTQPRARRAGLRAVLWCGVFLGFLALANGQAGGVLVLAV